ncbi:MAG: cbb3-type cytochrome c oxidase subunit I [Acidimicrobiales bacterium]
MTVTEAPGDVVDEVGEGAAAPTLSAPPTGLAALVGSGDPRTVGKLFIGTSLLFLLASGVAGVLIGFERVDLSGIEVLDSDIVQQVFTLHSTVGVFLGVLPLLIGLATAIVPLQVGASTIAFPRASAAAYWTFLVSGGIVLASYALDGGPFGNDSEAVDLFVVAFIALLVALAVATVSVVTTVLALRAPGMSLRRTPLFSWSMLVGGTVWLLTLPVLAGMLLLVYLDLRYGQQFLGGSGGIYNRIAWVFWQPTVYAFAVPALGIIGDIVPTFARRRHQQHRAAMVFIGLFAALGFGAWAQLGVTIDGSESPADWLYDGPWIAVGVVALLPIVGLLGLWVATLGRGKVKLGSPLILALFAGLVLAAGVAAGVVTVIGEVDVAATTWMTGQAYLVLVGTLVAAAAGLTFWAPKLYGRLLPEGLVRLGGTLLALGALAAGVAYGVGGLYDQPRVVAADGTASGVSEVDLVETLNLVAAIGLTVAVVGALAVAAALVKPARRGEGPGDDPWEGHTLEWTTSSPPPIGNFATLPEITSEAPLYDARYAPTDGESAANAESTEASA